MFFKSQNTACAFPSLALTPTPALPVVVTVVPRYTNFSTSSIPMLLQYVNQHAISASISIYHVTLESRVD